ncbi:MAG: type II toxin-antitoxin system HicB family antitoxin [Acidobacteriaceae bacterium]|jgi:predicted RNase H-like HicB family nuclease|nr:type II toxin-antitoxin system HicB family antitoxin [Acidobacteriaceae bacterium]
MTFHYPIVFETEASGAISAYIPGVPLYAQAKTHEEAERAMREMLTIYLAEQQPSHAPRTVVKVAKATISPRVDPKWRVDIMSAASLPGRRTSARKTASSRANGRPRRPRA